MAASTKLGQESGSEAIQRCGNVPGSLPSGKAPCGHISYYANILGDAFDTVRT